MSNIKKLTLFDHEGFLITSPEGKRGLFAWKDEGSRIRKKTMSKDKKKGDVQSWKKIWISSVYKSERYPDMPWRFGFAGGKYPFCRLHMDVDVFRLLLELIPFLYKEYFGVTIPWSTPTEIKREFKLQEDDEVTKLQRELQALRV